MSKESKSTDKLKSCKNLNQEVLQKRDEETQQNESVKSVDVKKLDTTNLKWREIDTSIELAFHSPEVDDYRLEIYVYNGAATKKDMKLLKKRLKACLNFCAGIDTKMLKNHKLTDYIKDGGKELE